jgi:hypothetical protein
MTIRRGALGRLLGLGVLIWVLHPVAATGANQDGDPVALLVAAADTTLGHPTMHFKMENTEGNTELFTAVRLEKVEGDIEQPDRFKATIEVEAVVADVDIKVVGIGETFWLQNPLQGGDDYERRDIDPDLLALARPDVIVRAISQIVTDPQVDGPAALDGVGTTVLSGVLDLAQIAEVAPELPAGSVNADKDLDVRIWIDGESLIRQIEITGPFVTQDDGDVVRVIELSRFGEPVEIEPPD